VVVSDGDATGVTKKKENRKYSVAAFFHNAIDCVGTAIKSNRDPGHSYWNKKNPDDSRETECTEGIGAG
jgi:hypothetical protein